MKRLLPYSIITNIRLAICLLFFVLLASCEQQSQFDRVKSNGELVVASFENKDPLEKELIESFATQHNLYVRYNVAKDLEDLLDMAKLGKAHIAIGRIIDTPSRRKALRITESYQEVDQQLVYRRGDRRPKSLKTLGSPVHVLTGSSASETLSKSTLASLSWANHRNLDVHRLLKMLHNGKIKFTIADSIQLSLEKRIFRHIKSAYTLSKKQKIAWALSNNGDLSLFKAANDFLIQQKSNGTIKKLSNDFFGHLDKLNFVEIRDFHRHYKERLPKLKAWFLEAEKETGIDWKLLAAVGYQESHWKTKAVSPTGVKGIMMLTLATASQVGVDDRKDPRQSILGGARYLKVVDKKISKRIQGLDRRWMTLASYNVGYGHLEDARVLTQRKKGNPDLWFDVKKYLPLLSDRNYYTTVKYGYARGREPVKYVGNIRNYYDLLNWREAHPDNNISD